MSASVTTPSPASGPRTRSRARKACRFCRHRKIKCNNQKPACRNCEEYGTACLYDDLPKVPRPSKARIAALEEENSRLRAAASEGHDDAASPAGTEGPSSVSRGCVSEGLQPHADHPRAIGKSPIHHDTPSFSQTAALAPLRGTSGGPSAPAPASIHSGSRPTRSRTSNVTPAAAVAPGQYYHGPTSTLFEEGNRAGVTIRGTRKILANATKPESVSTTRKSLIAEAAIQRHMETANLEAGKLDFDGVDPDLAMHLLNIHWNRQHHSFLVTYRPAFMRDMACGGRYFSRLLLNAIYFGASKFSNRPEVRGGDEDHGGRGRGAGWMFRERVRELLGGALDKSDITTIQALLIMTNSLFALDNERSSAWIYAGVAFRMATDLGLHIDAKALPSMSQLTDEDLEIRRRVFWGAFVVDKIQSLYQGRPVTLQECYTSVPIVFYDEFEELEPWLPFAYPGSSVAEQYPGMSAYSVSCFTQLCQLSVILNRILNKVYAEKSTQRNPEKLVSDCGHLQSELKAWKSELPPHLCFFNAHEAVENRNLAHADSKSRTLRDGRDAVRIPPPHCLSLMALYYVLVIILHRPFVSEGHLHNHTRLKAQASSSFHSCNQAATGIVGILRAYDAAFSVRRAPYLISYAAYVAATIHVRTASQRHSQMAQTAKGMLQDCLHVFDENGETNVAARRAKAVVESLMKRMNVTVADGKADPGAVSHAEAGKDVEVRATTSGTAADLSIPTGEEIKVLASPPNSTLWSSRADEEQQQQQQQHGQSSENNDIDIDAIMSTFMFDQPLMPWVVHVGNIGYHEQTQQQEHWDWSRLTVTTSEEDGRPPLSISSPQATLSSVADIRPQDAGMLSQYPTPMTHSSQMISSRHQAGGFGGEPHQQPQKHPGEGMDEEGVGNNISDLLFGFNGPEMEGIGL